MRMGDSIAWMKRERSDLWRRSRADCDWPARFQLVTDRVTDAWAHPVLLDGRLYLRYHDTLYCYDVAAR